MKLIGLAATLALVTLTSSADARRPVHHYAYTTSQGYGAGYYTNVSGHQVHRPMRATARPSGATARCGDGSWSFSEHHRGTCSHHGGVTTWL